MRAVVIIELEVRARSGCTLSRTGGGSTWTVARNDDSEDSVTLTPRMVADALDALRYFGGHLHGLGRLWNFSGDAHALAFRAAMTGGESAS